MTFLVAVVVGGSSCAVPGTTVRSPSVTAPPSCDPEEVRQILTNVVEAFNRGDDPARFFAPSSGGYTGGFQWYSASGRGRANVAIYQRDDLAAYFASRHSVGEHWSQLNLQHIAEGQLYPRADFSFLITRTAPDLAELTPAESTLGQTLGKGALNCKERSILVFTM